MIAKLSSVTKLNLDRRADSVNNGRTDGIYFYVNGKHVSVSHPHFKLSIAKQKEELAWFLDDCDFEFID